MAKWEPEVQNHLGFPEAIDGVDLLRRGMKQVIDYEVAVVLDQINCLSVDGETFSISRQDTSYRARERATWHRAHSATPDFPGVQACLGKSLLFCKDCDPYRVRGQKILIVGNNNEAADYALAMLLFTSSVTICTHGQKPRWDAAHDKWLEKYAVPVRYGCIQFVLHEDGQLTTVTFEEGDSVNIEAIFVTSGDIIHNNLARSVGAQVDEEGHIIVDHCRKTFVSGLYAAGCVTSASCQMIIAAG